MPGALASTLPVTVTATAASQTSCAVAPGSVKLPWQLTTISESPASASVGGVVSTTRTVRATDIAALPSAFTDA